MKRDSVPACAGIAHEGQQGFTLVEMAVVLVIIATITGMAIASGISVINAAQLSATNQKMAAIDQALMAFRLANNRLPCPAELTQNQGSSTYGTEGTCAAISNGVFRAVGNNNGHAVEGGVPTVTLGLPNDMIYDAWGSKFRYAVDLSMTYAGAFTATQIGAVSGNISVYAGPTYPAAAANARTTGAIYALISHGPNKHGGVTSYYTSSSLFFNAGSNNADELTNCHCTAAGAYGAYTGVYVEEAPYTYQSVAQANSSYNYDDIVTFKERWQMQGPGDIAGISPPRVFIADSGNNRIDVYDLQGNHLFNFGSSGAATGCASPPKFKAPTGVAADKYGNVWVADTTNNRIQKISVSAAGTVACVTEMPSGVVTAASDLLHFGTPKGIAVDNNNFIWVSNSQYFYVERLDAQTPPNWLTSIGHSSATCSGSTYTCCNPDLHGEASPWSTSSCTYTTGTDGFGASGGNGPQQIAIDAGNNVWIADPDNNRIEEFDLSLTNKLVITVAAGTPKGVAIDSTGDVWIADTAHNQVLEYTATGTAISTATFGSALFSAPQGLAVDPMGNIWVTDTGHSNVYKCTVPTSANASATNCTVIGAGTGSGSGGQQFNTPTAIAITAR